MPKSGKNQEKSGEREKQIGLATLLQGGQSATPDSEKFAKNREKLGKIGKTEEKSGRKGKNREGSFTLPLLTDRAGYATGRSTPNDSTNGVW